MNTVTVDQFAQALAMLFKAGFVGSFAACWAGALFGRLSGRGVLLFLRRRCRTWRRFSRAYDRTVWGQ
ncbi:hypothetical protein [Rhodanobacter panaciterrae]|uniref:hypothetical protein n=1 Tax=Rhodanobacter panaciterrae TaxID=490572 RepID=UPI00167B824B|nr:hypothetical protein [Rhodanobacter panaciterrae]